MKIINSLYSIMMVTAYGFLAAGALLQDESIILLSIVAMVIPYHSYLLMQELTKKPENKYKSQIKRK